MKHKMFVLLWSAMLALCFVVVGVLALLGYANAEISFWTRSAIESKAGKIVWIVAFAICFAVFTGLAIREYRNKNDQPST